MTASCTLTSESISMADIDDCSVSDYEPNQNRGLCSVVHDGKLYLHSGYDPGHYNERVNLLHVFDFSDSKWSKVRTKGDIPEAISGSSSTVIGDSLYIFGGWCHGANRNADVLKLSLVNFRWELLTDAAVQGGGPMHKDKAGMVNYGCEMLCVMGGYGHFGTRSSNHKKASYHQDNAYYSDLCWTNELHLFHIHSREWISPELTGVRPPPCAAFSFNRVDQHRVVLFGGRHQKERTNQLHILNMENWHWSGVIIPSAPDSPWPPLRSFHAACPLVNPDHINNNNISPHCASSEVTLRRKHPWLPCAAPDLSRCDHMDGIHVDPKVVVLWGMDNYGEPINDAWILNVNKLTWKKVVLPACAGPARIWHSTGAYYPVPQSATVVVVGGVSWNLFSTDEDDYDGIRISKSSLLEFGVGESLFAVALRFVASNFDLFSAMLKQLPRHITEAVQQERKRSDSRTCLQYVNFNTCKDK